MPYLISLLQLIKHIMNCAIPKIVSTVSLICRAEVTRFSLLDFESLKLSPALFQPALRTAIPARSAPAQPLPPVPAVAQDMMKAMACVVVSY